MDGFKPNPKMQCFKEGGQVKYETRKEHKEEVSADIAQDKKIIKKAFKMHDEQEHKGEHTNLSKLKKGGRTKKDGGTVRKYKTGGAVENVYGAKKSTKDIKDIAASKRQKPALLSAGKSVKKMADGGLTGMGSISDAERRALTGAASSLRGQGAISDEERRMVQGAVSDMEKQRQMDRIARAQKYLGPAQQAEFAGQERSFLGRKKGGKVCK